MPHHLIESEKYNNWTKPKRQKRSRYCIAAHVVMHTHNKAKTFPETKVNV